MAEDANSPSISNGSPNGFPFKILKLYAGPNGMMGPQSWKAPPDFEQEKAIPAEKLVAEIYFCLTFFCQPSTRLCAFA